MRAIDDSFVRRLFGDGRIEQWDVPVAVLTEALTQSAAKAFSGKDPTTDEIHRYLRTLHLDDILLACACALGRDAAWEQFILEYRPALYRAAEAMDRSGGARELADSLYGELFGLQERDGRRRSLFRYFHGRSSLGTWLRAILSQRFVDRVRTAGRHEPLPDDEGPAAVSAPPDPDRLRFVALIHTALTAALSALEPRERLRLGCYYAQDMTLAQIGRMLREHEGTVSRHLTRTRRRLRERMEAWLRTEAGLDDAGIEECYSSVAADPASLDLAQLLTSGSERKNPGADRSTTEGMP